jgi:hypothetical protein
MEQQRGHARQCQCQDRGQNDRNRVVASRYRIRSGGAGRDYRAQITCTAARRCKQNGEWKNCERRW